MTQTTEMELRVAKAISGFGLGEDRIAVARAAIRAMREPPDEMLKEAGSVENWGREMGCHQWCDEWHNDFWNRMIDAASPERK